MTGRPGPAIVGAMQEAVAVSTHSTGRERMEPVFIEVRQALIAIIEKHRVTREEYRAAVAWLESAGSQPHEIPLLLDVFLSPTVDDVNAPDGGTESNVEGPFYVPGAQLLQPPCAMPMRPDEPGDALVFSGNVRALDGGPLVGAMLDIWQSDAAGAYSYIHPDTPPGNLRGRLLTDGAGRFEVRTVIPAPYEIPKDGATGVLLAALGRAAFRPAHIHVKVTHDGFEPLTTQIYFEGDPWLDHDVVGAVKPALVTRLDRHNGGYSCNYDFVLAQKVGR